VLEPIGVDWDESPSNVADSVYVSSGSLGVITQVAVPVLSEFAVHVPPPLSEKTTGSLAMGVAGVVAVSVTTADTVVGVPYCRGVVKGWIVTDVGVATTVVEAVAAVTWPPTERP
jgi:hypothetical protein